MTYRAFKLFTLTCVLLITGACAHDLSLRTAQLLPGIEKAAAIFKEENTRATPCPAAFSRIGQRAGILFQSVLAAVASDDMDSYKATQCRPEKDARIMPALQHVAKKIARAMFHTV